MTMSVVFTGGGTRLVSFTLTYNHPSIKSIRTLGLYESTNVDWDFNELEGIQCDRYLVSMICVVHKLLRMPALKDGLTCYLTGDPKEVKDLSNRGTVKLSQSDIETDPGNWLYTVLLNMAQELARGSKKNRDVHNYFEMLTAQWPSLQAKWCPTKGSIVRKGDVIEVCLALCKQPAIDAGIAEGRRNFREHVAQFYDLLVDTIRSICRCSEFPTLKFLPNPTNFARLLVFIWSAVHNNENAYRDESFTKADSEKEVLMKRIGSHNWFDGSN